VPALPLERSTLAGVRLERADLAPLPVRLVVRAGRRAAPAVDTFVERLEREAAKVRARITKLDD
jgi:hypothetical protein